MSYGVTDPDRALVLAYAPEKSREALAALFRLDEALGQIIRGARDPIMGQMRLTWWHEALSGLGSGPPPPDPVLAGLIGTGVVPALASGSAIAGIVEGWEILLDPDLADDDLTDFARNRGGELFVLGGQVLGADHPGLRDAGFGWALCDLARHSSDHALADRALALAAPALRRAMEPRWPVRLRSLGALAALASADAVRGRLSMRAAGHPARMLRALRHRLTGR